MHPVNFLYISHNLWDLSKSQITLTFTRYMPILGKGVILRGGGGLICILHRNLTGIEIE